MATNTSYSLTPNSQKIVKDFVRARYLSYGISTVRDRFERIDQALQLENKERREIMKDSFSDTEISLCAEPVNTATSFLTGIYLNKPEVFEAVTKNKELLSAAAQIQAINQENSKATGWERELPLYFRDCVKYNFGAVECKWSAEQTQVIGTDSTGSGSGAAIETVLREGNEMTRRDPYNTFYDTTVPINLVHKKGEFSGYVEEITMIDLATRVENLKVTGESQGANPVMNLNSIFNLNRTGVANQHFTPTIRPEVQADRQNVNTIGSFFSAGSVGNTTSNNKNLSSNTYEWVVMYARIIPSMFNMKIPGGDKPQIWKFIIINWETVIFAEKQTNVHNFFGLITTQVLEEGLQDQNKSLAEFLIPIQNLSTKLYDARQQGIRRNISDRGIYMQGVIDKKDINDNNPTAKIPMRPNMFVKDARAAYYSMPYNDNLGPSILTELAFLERTADRTSQTNAPQRGQFQKGNKTLGEFNEIMSNADVNMRAMALLLEASSMAPLKTITMSNILQYMPPTELTNSETGERVQLDPVALREAKLVFKLADGLRTKDSILDTEGLNNFMNLVLQVPQLQQKYDISEVVGYMFGQAGADITQFEFTPEQLAQQQAREQLAGDTNEQT
jgi:hypothetical protein